MVSHGLFEEMKDIRTGDGPVSFLAGGIPDLRLDRLSFRLHGSCRKFYANGRLGVEVEFVSREAGQKIRLSDTRIADKDHLGVVREMDYVNMSYP